MEHMTYETDECKCCNRDQNTKQREKRDFAMYL